MNKKIISGTLGIMMLTGIIKTPIFPARVSVFSTDPPPINITHTQGSSFTLSIPNKTFDLSTGEEKELTISMASINLNPNEILNVKINGGINDDGTFELTRNGNTTTKLVSNVTIALNGSGSFTAKRDAIVASFKENEKDAIKKDLSPSGKLIFSKLRHSNGDLVTEGNPVRAGEYTGTLTFSADITKVPSQGQDPSPQNPQEQEQEQEEQDPATEASQAMVVVKA